MEDFTSLVERILFIALGKEVKVNGIEMQSGGCINISIKAMTIAGNYFVKWNDLSFEEMFAKEAMGLQLLKDSHCIRIPEVISVGTIDDKAFIVQEFLDSIPMSAEGQEKLGECLALLHHTKQDHFGLHDSNFIGRLDQNNDPKRTWVGFFIENRLNIQLGLAIYRNEVDEDFIKEMKRFLRKLPVIMPESEASLLHGDLWNGNVLNTPKGPAIFDPAVYYGAREMDIAMTKLFGGFDDSFYEAYQSNYPLSKDFDDLVDVYNLYPLMVHVNLFGAQAGYLGMVKRIIKRYL